MKDYRYRTVKFLIEAGKIKRMHEIFHHVPKTTVLRDFRINFGRFNQALADPSNFRIKELQTLADLFGIDARLLLDMAYEQSCKKRGRPRGVSQTAPTAKPREAS